ncbi:MAG TPA: hypothetical protein VMS65_00040, partial [Polyangiaceae bacterium]|nr:hypothetical protein [Polyangiaceae bacterium]
MTLGVGWLALLLGATADAGALEGAAIARVGARSLRGRAATVFSSFAASGGETASFVIALRLASGL